MSTTINTIPGLHYHPNYLSVAEQKALVGTIDQQPWLGDLKRRVQHYGYRYDYTRKTVDASAYLGPLPDWALHLAERLYQDGWAPQIPEQVIVNEYLPGQGISSHIDCIPCFGDTILSISLGSPCVMLFTHSKEKITFPILLEPGSLVVMQEDARYKWKHSIPARKTDQYEGRSIVRGRRISLTLRTMIHSAG